MGPWLKVQGNYPSVCKWPWPQGNRPKRGWGDPSAQRLKEQFLVRPGDLHRIVLGNSSRVPTRGDPKYDVGPNPEIFWHLIWFPDIVQVFTVMKWWSSVLLSQRFYWLCLWLSIVCRTYFLVTSYVTFHVFKTYITMCALPFTGLQAHFVRLCFFQVSDRSVASGLWRLLRTPWPP